MKRISILGSTGSIGKQALSVAMEHPESFRIVALSANTNWELLLAQAKVFEPELVCIADEKNYEKLKQGLQKNGLADKVEACRGMEGMLRVSTLKSSDIVLTAVVGMIGLRPTVAAIRAKKDIALANKETLVTAGHIIMDMARENGVRILPVDSEHSAIFQCLQGEENNTPKRILLTASGGAFRTWEKERIARATRAQALQHPTWNMGEKITIDSASLMNKGLEMVEASYLFDVPPERIEVVVHPESIVHSMVEYIDGSVIAQLSDHDMRLAIQYALSYPKRLHRAAAPLDFFELASLHFEKPDTKRFPCLALAYRAASMEKSALTVMNAANEALVAAFLKDQISFHQIAEGISLAMEAHPRIALPSLDEILGLEEWSHAFVADYLSQH